MNVFAVVAGSGSGKLCWHSRRNDNDQKNAGYVRESAGGSEQVLRLRARDGAFRAPARVTFFFCQKKVTKEKHSNLRFKDPLARYGSCKIGVLISRNWYGGYRCRFGGLLVPPAPLPLTTARVGAGTLVVFGDYQIAPIAARSTAMGRWRLTPPGYGGTCLPAGRSAGLTRHRRAIQHREPSRGKAWRLRAGVQRKFTVFLQNLKVELRKASML